mmetsp:Transcript_5571/g.8432  ORF Transcript_5571/g.8432 Transcript_5571/m.8432 type:complete len:97 (+) Transcript_5571:703-993(+)
MGKKSGGTPLFMSLKQRPGILLGFSSPQILGELMNEWERSLRYNEPSPNSSRDSVNVPILKEQLQKYHEKTRSEDEPSFEELYEHSLLPVEFNDIS